MRATIPPSVNHNKCINVVIPWKKKFAQNLMADDFEAFIALFKLIMVLFTFLIIIILFK